MRNFPVLKNLVNNINPKRFSTTRIENPLSKNNIKRIISIENRLKNIEIQKNNSLEIIKLINENNDNIRANKLLNIIFIFYMVGFTSYNQKKVIGEIKKIKIKISSI